MPLAPGFRLGPYEILRLIGAGGMGEVYRARDTRLERTVAIKVLAEDFAADPDRRARFEREARAVAALSHSHICALHDVGESPGAGTGEPLLFLVMEHIEGQTLAERLLSGALPAGDVVRYASELADALDHAHRRGLVHRDVKPSNIMLTRGGAKLLDFGLSKMNPSPDLIALSTLSPGGAPLTTAGALMGTYPYMSPEQLAGREADARSDIFATGAIVYEMATGRRAFEGSTAATVIGAVLHTHPPPVSSLQPLAPLSLDRIVSRCLAKDPDDRWQTARDLVLELKWIADAKDDGPAGRAVLVRSTIRERTAWMISGVLLLLLAAIGISYLRRTPPDTSVQRLSLLPPAGINVADAAYGGGAAISPDGERVAFIGFGEDGKKLLWVRPLNRLDAEPMPASEGAEYPFWSPDSRSIGFFAQGKLKKVAAVGGAALTLCNALQPRGGAWNDQGIILFSANAGERWYRVDAGGGNATPVTIDRPNSENYWPVFLPDGRHFIYFGRPEKRGIYVASLDSQQATLLLGGEQYVGVAYAPPGFLLTLAGSSREAQDRALVARPFDASRLEITGEPVVLGEHVAYRTLMARAAFSVSQTGRVVYETDRTPATELQWFDRRGARLATLGGPLGYLRPALSPNEKTVAVERLDTQAESSDIWLLDTARGIPSRLTTDPASEWMPVWSPDGNQVVFTSPRGAPPSLYLQDSRRAGAGDMLLQSNRVLHPGDWSKDGRFLVYAALDSKTQWDLWTLPMNAAAGSRQQPEPFLRTDFNESNGQFSPDGHWMAYVSDESGRQDIYVESFPVSGNRRKISANGGSQPRWRRDGQELFYVGPDGTLMAVSVTSSGTFEAAAPRPLFKTRITDTGTNGMNYAVTSDGQRFLVHTITDDTPTSSMTLLLNWLALAGR